MAIGIHFERDKAAQMVESLATGNPVSARTRDEMLMLAGACLFAAMSHGPDRHRGTDWDKVPAEHREATEEIFFRDLHAAIGVYSNLAMLVRDNEYDQQFEPEIRAIAYGGGGKNNARAVAGVQARKVT